MRLICIYHNFFTKYAIYDQNRLQLYWIEDVEMKNVHWDYNMFPRFA